MALAHTRALFTHGTSLHVTRTKRFLSFQVGTRISLRFAPVLPEMTILKATYEGTRRVSGLRGGLRGGLREGPCGGPRCSPRRRHTAFRRLPSRRRDIGLCLRKHGDVVTQFDRGRRRCTCRDRFASRPMARHNSRRTRLRRTRMLQLGVIHIRSTGFLNPALRCLGDSTQCSPCWNDTLTPC